MKNKRCKSFLSSALLACTLMAPGMASADPIEYVFEITYEGVDDSLIGLGNQSIYGLGVFSFFSETVIDFTSSTILQLNSISPWDISFNADFHKQSDYSDPSFVSFSSNDFTGLGLKFDNNQVFFSNPNGVSDFTIENWGSTTYSFLDHFESGTFNLEEGTYNDSGLPVSNTFVSSNQGSTTPFYLMTLRTDDTGSTPDNGSGTPIPEPAAWALFLVGLGTLLTRKRA